MRYHLVALILTSLSSIALAGPTSRPWQAPDLNPVKFGETPRHAPVVLIDHGKPVANLCVMGNVDPMALEELQKCIKLATGTELPVVHDQIKLPALVIGGPTSGIKFPPEGFLIRT